MLPDDMVTTLGSGYLVIPTWVLNEIRTYNQDHFNKPESGGILLGMYRGPHIEITNITTPSKGDDKGRSYFERKCQSHVDSAHEAWINNNHYVTYIGEWHTHPEAVPTPSSIDIQSWKNKLPSRPMITLISGYSDFWVGLSNEKRQIKTLPKLIFDTRFQQDEIGRPARP